MLRVPLAEVRAGAVDTTGELAADDPLLADAGVVLAGPLRVAGRLSSAGKGKYYWRAHFETAVSTECRRCLKAVEVHVSQPLALIFATQGEAAEDHGCYVIEDRARVLDLTEAVREELLLAIPRFVECRPDCRGLCPTCGADLNDSPCGCAPAGDPRWQALRALTHPDPKGD